MFRKFTRLFSSTAMPTAAGYTLDVAVDVAPDTSFVAIGDIHGCLDQLEAQLAQVDADPDIPDDAPLVCIGDYVDRGPNSAQVLTKLRDLQSSSSRKVICIKGNHEVMMREFIDDPIGSGARWLRFGGLDTLASFGITKPNTNNPDQMLDASEALEAAVQNRIGNWLETLPLQWSTGNVSCVHAAMNPAKAITKQSDRTRLWGHPSFLDTDRDDDEWVVFGHTVHKRPNATQHRIAIDTGAYETGLLTAAYISTGNVRFLCGVKDAK